MSRHTYVVASSQDKFCHIHMVDAVVSPTSRSLPFCNNAPPPSAVGLLACKSLHLFMALVTALFKRKLCQSRFCLLSRDNLHPKKAWSVGGYKSQNIFLNFGKLSEANSIPELMSLLKCMVLQLICMGSPAPTLFLPSEDPTGTLQEPLDWSVFLEFNLRRTGKQENTLSWMPFPTTFFIILRLQPHASKLNRNRK